MNKFLFLLFLLLPSLGFTQVQIQGVISDSITQEPLPFVNIAVKGTTKGCVSSMNGKFMIEVTSLPVTLLFSYVGYQKKEIRIENSTSVLKIKLMNSGLNLKEATVFSGLDPGLIIMRKTVENRNKNNPEKNGSFSYLSYNKLVFTLGADEPAINRKADSLKNDSIAASRLLFYKKQHLFLSESVSERKYKSASKNKETILAAKVSGFSTPVFTLLSTQLQSFHFYDDAISLSDVKYIGPVSDLGLKHYRFIISDTLFIDKDTIYAIRFFPKKEGDTRSLKGVMQIHSDGYALYNVIAEPDKYPETGFGISIWQQYEKIDHRQWFPVELNTTLTFSDLRVDQFPIVGIGTGTIRDIKLNPSFSKKDFDELEIDINDTSLLKSEEQLIKLRAEELDDKEQNTYRVIDSIGKKHNLDKKMLVMQSLIYGYVPVKFLDWDISKLFNYNEYEGFRLGLALRTNHKISKWFSLGGYLAYGFNDKAWKYGTDLNLVFSKRRQIELNLAVQQDVEPASIVSAFEKRRYASNAGFSNLLLSRFDSVLRYESKISFRMLKHFKITLFGNYQIRNAYENYRFLFPLSEDITLLDPDFNLAETGAEIKLAIHEKFIKTPFGYISKGTKWPLLIARYTKGISGIINSEYDYQRITLKADHALSSLKWGALFLSFTSGMTQGQAPYHLLFSPVGTYRPISKLAIYSIDGFETMRPNEFLFDKYFTFHGRYRFVKPVINRTKFKPYLSLSSSLAYGVNSDFSRHLHVTYSNGRNPFTESGIIIDNLVKSGFSGMGVGVFYRWGFHQFPAFKDNIAVKISISLSLN